MKYLLVLGIVFIVLWLWRSNRRAPPVQQRPPGEGATAQPRLQDMVSCAVCDLHVPLADATTGQGGAVYCSVDHRRRAEG